VKPLITIGLTLAVDGGTMPIVLTGSPQLFPQSIVRATQEFLRPDARCCARQ
jgi:hypothetical protein